MLLTGGCGATQLALLCVSQIIPALADNKTLDHFEVVHQKEEVERTCLEHLAEAQVLDPKTTLEDVPRHLDSVTKTLATGERQQSDLAASVELLSPLLVCCMDDDWNPDVRKLAIEVVQQLFLDLQVLLPLPIK